ncbi:MAG: SDR family NAD(P)-dependent oxidoreductase [Verrucomicrobia bacterium]|nr:SDR family NAD(P)-dependent oxidoreductase [Verrucomicrobiota bacterium]
MGYSVRGFSMTSAPPLQRVVLVTGAAGGLGRGLVQEFAAQGWRVGAAYHRTAPPVETEFIWPVPLDVTNPDDAAAVTNRVLSRWGRIDALVNNAGVVADQSLARMTEAEWDRVVDVNLKGAFLCAQAVLRPMLRQHDGHIINISSFTGRVGARGQANYAAAKAGLIGLTQSLAREAGPRNVRVNAVLPGVLPTPMTATLAPDVLSALAAAGTLGRLNDVAEVARFVVFLATLQNVSGQLFQLDSRIAAWT